MALNLEKQLLFYGSYHHDPVNIGIHIVCVPVLLVTGFLLASTSPELSLPSYAQIPYYPINLGTTGGLLYSSLFILMEPVAGAMLAPLILCSAAYMNHLTDAHGSTAVYWGLGIHIASWLAQFVGHGKFEGRAPALLDNLIQAIFLAPFFVWLEILFFFGYRPELKGRLDKLVEEEIAKFRSSKGKKLEKELSNGTADGKKQ